MLISLSPFAVSLSVLFLSLSSSPFMLPLSSLSMTESLMPLLGAALEISLRKKYFQTLFSHCKLVDMVCRMKSHQGRFQKKSFSCVLCAFYHVFFLFCLEKCVFGWFLVVFTVVWPLVSLLDPPFFTGSSGHPSCVYILYSLLYQMK
jgi:hypothetical protein